VSRLGCCEGYLGRGCLPGVSTHFDPASIVAEVAAQEIEAEASTQVVEAEEVIYTEDE